MSQKESGNISIANILALVGLAGIGVITFMGTLLHSADGKPTGAILGALALVAALGFFLFMSIKAKGAEDNPDKWRYVEWACLLLYVVVAVAFASPFQRFFHVVSEKSEMQQQARSEIAAIKSLYTSYEHQQKKYMNEAVEQVQNYLASGQMKSTNDALAEYVKGIGSNVDSWASKASAIVAMPKDKELSELEGKVESWNIMTLSSLAIDLEQKDSEAWAKLEKKIAKYGVDNKLIPVIIGGGTQPYSLDGLAKFDLGQKPEAKFAQMLHNADGNTPLGWIIYVVLNLLVLLNYLVAERSAFVGPTKRKGDTGGLDL